MNDNIQLIHDNSKRFPVAPTYMLQHGILVSAKPVWRASADARALPEAWNEGFVASSQVRGWLAE